MYYTCVRASMINKLFFNCPISSVDVSIAAICNVYNIYIFKINAKTKNEEER